MSATYMHIGIPITNKKPGMTHNEGMRLWMSNPEDARRLRRNDALSMCLRREFGLCFSASCQFICAF